MILNWLASTSGVGRFKVPKWFWRAAPESHWGGDATTSIPLHQFSVENLIQPKGGLIVLKVVICPKSDSGGSTWHIRIWIRIGKKFLLLLRENKKPVFSPIKWDWESSWLWWEKSVLGWSHHLDPESWRRPGSLMPWPNCWANSPETLTASGLCGMPTNRFPSYLSQFELSFPLLP